MRMSPALFDEFHDNPLGMDAIVRKQFQIPENRYYTVAVFPEHLKGRITVERERHVKATKISKSNA